MTTTIWQSSDCHGNIHPQCFTYGSSNVKFIQESITFKQTPPQKCFDDIYHQPHFANTSVVLGQVCLLFIEAMCLFPVKTCWLLSTLSLWKSFGVKSCEFLCLQNHSGREQWKWLI